MYIDCGEKNYLTDTANELSQQQTSVSHWLLLLRMSHELSAIITHLTCGNYMNGDDQDYPLFHASACTLYLYLFIFLLINSQKGEVDLLAAVHQWVNNNDHNICYKITITSWAHGITKISHDFIPRPFPHPSSRYLPNLF